MAVLRDLWRRLTTIPEHDWPWWDYAWSAFAFALTVYFFIKTWPF